MDLSLSSTLGLLIFGIQNIMFVIITEKITILGSSKSIL